MRFRRSHRTTWNSRMFSPNRQPRSYHRTGHGIVPLTCCQELNSPRVEYTPCPFRSARQWRIASRRLSNKSSFVPPTSPAACSFFVGKKDESLQPCIDYRTVNDHTVKLPYPLSLVTAALEELCGTCIFSELDMRSDYNLICIRQGNEWKTVGFITPSGHYEYRVMLYGLSNSLSVFQGFMSEVFREFLHLFVIVFIDIILIYYQNMAEYCHHVMQVLCQLRKHFLYLKLEKCEFHRPEVQILGYILSANWIQMDQGKVQPIRDWSQPQSVKELQRFLGFANFYQKLIQNFSLLSAPLTSMVHKKPKSLSWNSKA